MGDDAEKALPSDLTLADVGLRLFADESGTSLEFTSSGGTAVVLRINDLAGTLNRHDAETLRCWSADRQAKRML